MYIIANLREIKDLIALSYPVSVAKIYIPCFNYDCVYYDLNRVYLWLLPMNSPSNNLPKTEFRLIASRQRLSAIFEIPSFTVSYHPVMQIAEDTY